MKNSHISILAVAAFALTFISLTGCGGNEPAKETETTKPSAADMFTDDRPAYDAKAINPDAAVNAIDLKAIGNTMADISYDQKSITVNCERYQFSNN